MTQAADAAELARLRAALLEAGWHLLDAANALEDTARASAAACCRLLAAHTTRAAAPPAAVAGDTGGARDDG